MSLDFVGAVVIGGFFAGWPFVWALVFFIKGLGEMLFPDVDYTNIAKLAEKRRASLGWMATSCFAELVWIPVFVYLS